MSDEAVPLHEQSIQQPHVIHIGFAKCASTYLQEWFAAHPQIRYKPGGLAGIYTIYDLIATVCQTPAEIRCTVTSAEQISAPIDPAHFGRIHGRDTQLRHRIEIVCAKLAGMFPEARILIITRNHRDVMKSSYSQMVSNGQLAFGNDMHALSTLSIKDSAPFDYDHALKVYARYFEERVLALPYELLVDDEIAFLRHVADFMGVDAYVPSIGRVNAGLSEDELYYYPRIGTFLGHFALSGWLYRRLSSFHRIMIKCGGWKPLITILARSKKPRTEDFALSNDVLETMAKQCVTLVKPEVYAPYRKLYLRQSRDADAPL